MTTITDLLLWPLDRLFDVLKARHARRLAARFEAPAASIVQMGHLTAEACALIRGASSPRR